MSKFKARPSLRPIVKWFRSAGIAAELFGWGVREKGYDDSQIGKMKPEEALRILGI